MDDPTVVEEQGEDLTGLSAEELDSLDAELSERGDELADGELSDEDLAELETLADRRDSVRAERARRAEDAAVRSERAQSALARLRGESADDVVDEVTDDAELEDTDAERVPAVAAATVPAVVASGRRGPSGLNRLRPAPVAVKPAAARQSFMVATGALGMGVDDGTPLDSPFAVAKAICDKRNSWSRIPSGVHDDRIKIATGHKTFTDGTTRLGPDVAENFATLQAARKDRMGLEAGLVASGAFCTPLSPLYDFFRLAVAQTPVEDSLPVVTADRGGIRYIGALCDLTEAFEGITVLTPLQNLDVDNPDLKACVHVGCPDVVEKVVSSVSTCVEFGNLQYRTFPELVENFMADLAVAFAITKETMYLDAIHAAATATTFATMTYGASRTIVYAWTMAAVAFRKRHNMAKDATVKVWAPDWAMELIRTDMAMDAYNGGGSNMAISDGQVTEALTTRHMDVTWFNDRATALATQKFNGAQAAGALNCWPNTVTSYMTAPGTFVRLDGGTLDVGLVRDSTLNASNDLQLFMEEWLGIAQVGCEVMGITVTTEPSGAAPAGVTPFACP